MIIKDAEFKNFKNYIPQLLKINLYNKRRFECCPHCGSVHFVRHGKYNGIQRYKCCDCNRTFSQTTKSLWYCSKKKSNLWVEFTELFLQKKTVRECAETLKINLATAFYWRHKIMNLLKSTHIEAINPERLKGDIYIKSLFFQENSYNTVINFKEDFYFREKRIFVAAARGEDDSMLIIPFSRNHFRFAEFEDKVSSRIEGNSYIISCRDKFVEGIAIRKNKKKSRKNKKKNNEPKINKIKDNIEQWFKSFHGISTKYLESYITHFILCNVDKCFKSLDTTYLLLNEFNFIKTDKIKEIKLSI